MSAQAVLREAVSGFEWLVVAYLVALNLSYTLLLGLGWSEISRWVRRRRLRDFETIAGSELSLPVSIIVPAFDEEKVIVASVRSLLGAQYPRFEVVIVNDGSSDATFDELRRAFALVPVSRVPRARLQTERVRGVWVGANDPRVVLVDKENGGKADALNAGLSYARYPLFCAVDSDTMLDPDALPRLVWHFQARPETVACGGIVRIVNGSSVDGARVTSVRTPRSLVACLQIVEYLRAFLVGRTGWSRLGMLLIISGAFGMFRREAVIAAGGYATDTVGEDAELVVRLHRRHRELGEPYRVAFVADPVCWTEAPSSLRALARQRDRWQRGLLETLARHRGMIGRRRYGRVGLVGLPYLVLFEALGPLLEALAYPATVAALTMGWLDPRLALAILALTFTYGLALSFGALRIEERAFQRYARWRCLGRLMLAVVVENFGYRQWSTLVRARAAWTLLRRRGQWGHIARVGYHVEVPIPEPLPAALAPAGGVPAERHGDGVRT